MSLKKFLSLHTVHAVAMKRGGSLPILSYTLSKIHHKIFNLQQTCKFFHK